MLDEPSPTTKPRPRFIRVLAVIVLLSLAGLGFHGWKTLVPRWQVQGLVQRCEPHFRFNVMGPSIPECLKVANDIDQFERVYQPGQKWDFSIDGKQVGKEIEDYGGEERAVRDLLMYLDLPPEHSRKRATAVLMLAEFGSDRTTVKSRLQTLAGAASERAVVRRVAAQALESTRTANDAPAPDGRPWKNGQVVELTGVALPSKADARFYIRTDRGGAAHLKGKVIEAQPLTSGDRLRVKGRIEYVLYPPLGERNDSTRAFVRPQTVCYLHVTTLKKIKSAESAKK